MARLGSKTPKKKETVEEVRDTSPIVSAYSVEGQKRIAEENKKSSFGRKEKIILIVGNVLLLGVAILIIYLIETFGG